MSTTELDKQKQLEILHDHYKETFSRLLQVEASRDRLFLWVISLLTLLSLEIGYPSVVIGVLGKVSVSGGELNLQGLPLPVLLNATWMLTLAVGLRYCQMTVLTSRQYPYLHTLEDTISPLVGGGDVYRREGKVYLEGYPWLLDAAWYAYVLLFPLIVITTAAILCVWEWGRLQYPLPHKLFDTLLAAAIVIFFVLYRMQPVVVKAWKQLIELVGRLGSMRISNSKTLGGRRRARK